MVCRRSFFASCWPRPNPARSAETGCTGVFCDDSLIVLCGHSSGMKGDEGQRKYTISLQGGRWRDQPDTAWTVWLKCCSKVFPSQGGHWAPSFREMLLMGRGNTITPLLGRKGKSNTDDDWSGFPSSLAVICLAVIIIDRLKSGSVGSGGAYQTTRQGDTLSPHKRHSNAASSSWSHGSMYLLCCTKCALFLMMVIYEPDLPKARRRAFESRCAVRYCVYVCVCAFVWTRGDTFSPAFSWESLLYRCHSDAIFRAIKATEGWAGTEADADRLSQEMESNQILVFPQTSSWGGGWVKPPVHRGR